MGACMSTSKKALQSHRAEIEKHARPAMAALQAKVQSNKAESNTTASKEEDTAKADTTKSSTATTNANIAETAPSTPKSAHHTTTTIITHSSPSSQHGQLQQQRGGEAPEPAREQKNPYQDALNDALMAQGDRMANHLAENEATLLAPIHGWSLEKYATVQAHIAQNSSLYDKILEKHGITKSEWEAIDQGWQQRMRDDKDTGAVMSQYGKYYMAAGTGDYGTSAKEAANVMNIAGVSTGEAPSAGGETDQVSFDKYLEWIGAQGAWSNLGLDVNAKLKEVFGITAHDYSNVAGYWSMKMMSDMNLAMKMGTDIQKWTAVYMQHPNGPPK